MNFGVLTTIKARLILYYVLSLIATFLVFIAVAGFIVWRILVAQVDHHLQTVASEAEKVWQSSRSERNNLISALVSSEGMVVVVLSSDGTPLLETSSADMNPITEHQLQTILVRQQNNAIDTPYFFTALNTRFATLPVSVPPGSGVIAVGYSLKVLNQAFEQLIILLGIVLLFSLIPLVLIGYLLSKRALSPVGMIVETADRISSSRDLSGRIPSLKGQDEIGQLIQTLNLMFDRLEQSFDREKQFFEDAAHTLKTPLTAIRVQIESLKGINNEKLDKILTHIDDAAGLVGDLLLLGRVEAGIGKRKGEIDLSKLLFSLEELTRTLASEKHITVKSDIGKGLTLMGDDRLILRALTNVIDNAIFYTKEEGSIIISGVKKGENILVSVSDTGIGIKKEDIPFIFERFYRSKERGGSGLGLAISKAITESFGGSISVFSKVNKGTTITFQFPLI